MLKIFLDLDSIIFPFINVYVRDVISRTESFLGSCESLLLSFTENVSRMFLGGSFYS